MPAACRGVTLAVSPSSISENGGAATVTATLDRPSGAATTVTVTPVAGFYTVASSTATITIAAGSTSNATDTATIAAVDDAIYNPSGRTVTVTGVAASSLGVGTLTGAPLTLTDDDEKGLARPLGSAGRDGRGARPRTRRR